MIEHKLKIGCVALAAVALLIGLGLLAGCPSQNNLQQSEPPVAQAASFGGAVFGGRQPIVAASVVVYASGATVGAPPTEIGSAFTDSNGRWSINFSPQPASGQVVYVIAKGGIATPGGGYNSAIKLMTVAGIQDSVLAPLPATVNINELTTVASAATLKDYMNFADCSSILNNNQFGTCVSIPGAPGLDSMAATVTNLANPVTGRASAFATGSTLMTTALEKMDTLADILAACVNAAGPAAGGCTNLFNTLGNPPDTLYAVWLSAASPIANAKGAALYRLQPTMPIFTPTLAAAPATVVGGYWTVGSARHVFVANSGDNTVSVFSFGGEGSAGAGLTQIAGSPFAEGGSAESIAVDPTGRYEYVANFSANSVSAYSIGPNGAPTAIAGSPFAAGSNPYSVAVDPTGRYVYVANAGDGSVSAYTIGLNGALTPVAGSPFDAGSNSNATAVAVDPTGRYVYVATYVGGGNGTVLAYTIGTDGKLTPVPGSPFAAGPSAHGVAVGPSGRHVYVANYNLSKGTGSVSAYTIGTDGALTQIPGSPFAAGVHSIAVTVDPTGRFLYVGNEGSDSVSVYTIGARSALLTAVGTPVPTGSQPQSVALAPRGRYVYVANEGGNTISAYALGADGTLTPLGRLATGSHPYAVAVDPGGRYVYVANSCQSDPSCIAAGSVSAYAIGADGSLTSLGTAPSGSLPFAVVVDPSGRYVYVANGGDNTISGYSVGTNGTLTPLGTPIATGTSPVALAVDPDGGYVLVVNQGLAVYSIGSGGALTAVGTPAVTGAGPVALAVDPSGRYVYVANELGNTVSAYAIGADGTLTTLGTAATGNLPFAVAVDASGRYVYVANANDNTTSVYKINADGTLAALDTVATGNSPVSIAAGP